MPDDNDENSNKIEKIYRIIEFEIDNANNQISLSKKDNINFILLLFALIGFFAFIPADTFSYQWIANSILMTFVVMAMVGCISGWFYYCIVKRKFESSYKDISEKKDCNLCDSSTICPRNTETPDKRENALKYVYSTVIEYLSLFLTALIYTSFILFGSAMILYFYYTASNEVAPLYQNSPHISLLLMIILLVFVIIYIRCASYKKAGLNEKYLLELTIISTFIAICSIWILFIGYSSRIQPFIPITNTSQFSNPLIEHITVLPSVPLSYIVTLYTLIIGLVIFEYFFSSKYMENIEKNLNKLLMIKYRIDRYQLGLSPDLHIDDLVKKVSKLKIYPPSYHTFLGIVSIPIPMPFDFINCEEILYLSQEDPIVQENKKPED
jgi:MFS family permease